MTCLGRKLYLATARPYDGRSGSVSPVGSQAILITFWRDVSGFGTTLRPGV